jgi:hypothetical protein
MNMRICLFITALVAFEDSAIGSLAKIAGRGWALAGLLAHLTLIE